MCGINGLLRLTPHAPALDRDEVLRTREYQARRGPDGSGLWESGDGRIALAHNRLAIIDLSAAGAQPMHSEDRRYHITFNGEIYNFRSLRDDLQRLGVRLHTESDTEVLLALYAREGVNMLPRLRGMYAFALWDDAAKVLLLARDPFGIKPLYYAASNDVLRFASQVKALLAGGGVNPEMDLGALAGFLLWGSVPEPLTIRQAVRAVPAGHFLLVEDGSIGEPHRHYLPGLPGLRSNDVGPSAAALPREPLYPGVGLISSLRDASAEFAGHAPTLAEALADSVAAHLVADVAVAVFLSAGLDSALIAALARHVQPDLTTLTVRFPALYGTPADEGPLAARVAGVLGTNHRELEISAEQLRALWPSALAAMDQPSIDGFNTFVIAKAAHEAGFKVVLSGVGGDELLGGYPSFRSVPRVARLAALAVHAPGLAAVWPRIAATTMGDRPKLAGLLRYGSTIAGAYFLRRALFLPEELPTLLGADVAAEAVGRYDAVGDAETALTEPLPPTQLPANDAWLAVHQLETARYLRNQLLRDSDWAAMAWSVELRVPLVDAWLRAAAAHCRFGPARQAGKATAVRASASELPTELFDRKKTGFYIPLSEALDATAHASTHGARSRMLALQALRALGLDLPRSIAPDSHPEPAVA